MTSAAHTVTGIAIAHVLSKSSLFVGFDPKNLMLASIILSNAPDINLVWKKSFIKHHEDITHYPLFGLAVFLGLYFVEAITFRLNYALSTLFLLTYLMHVFMDTFGHTVGIHWLYPFSKKEYSFTRLRKDIQEKDVMSRFLDVFKGKVFVAELATIVTSLTVILKF
jgi:membrane-bound metal-dependent hydrolase YbcI (DUF457 family)